MCCQLAAMLGAESVLWGSRESRPSPPHGGGVGDRTSPGETTRKQGSPKSEMMEWHLSTAGRAEERETQVQLAAAVRLRGHHQETRRKDGRMLSPLTQASYSISQKHTLSPRKRHRADHSCSLHHHQKEALRRWLWNESTEVNNLKSFPLLKNNAIL